jgi:hypothetical protein
MTQIACDLGVFTEAQRADHERESNAVLGSLIDEAYELEDGLELRYGDAPHVAERVQSWIAGERRCCPFFRFSLRVEQPGGVVLRITGPREAKEILLPQVRSRGVRVLPAPPEERRPRSLWRAGWLAGGGALLCVAACAAPMLLAGGALGTAGLAIAGYAEIAGAALVLVGLALAVVAVVRRVRRRPASMPTCDC